MQRKCHHHQEHQHQEQEQQNCGKSTESMDWLERGGKKSRQGTAMNNISLRLAKGAFLLLVILFIMRVIVVVCQIAGPFSSNTWYKTTTSRQDQRLKRPRLNSTTMASLLDNSFTIPDSVDIFYSNTRKDRAGGAILDMLMAHAFAWAMGRQYGGVCGPKFPHSNDHRRMIEVLGLQDELPYPAEPPSCDTLNATYTTNNHMVLPRLVYMNWKDTNIFTPEWIKYIRQRQKLPSSSQQHQKEEAQNKQQPQQQNKQNKKQQHRILMHVRRGDVTPCIPEYFRYTPNSHYLHLLQEYTTNNNNATDTFYNVTIYSESKTFEPLQDFYNFSSLHHLTFQLSLDGDIAPTWSDMLGYNDHPSIPRTLILSLSSFSLVPAILASPSTTVVYTPFWHKPLPHWKVVGLIPKREAELKTKRLREQYCSSQS